MATVFELSEPYANHLIPVLAPGPGVCATCWTAVDASYSRCFKCNAARITFRSQLADVVVPIALAVKREQLAHELWHYKYSQDADVRARLQVRLAAVLWRFLGEHEGCIASALPAGRFDIVTTVPGTRQRSDDHPLVQIVGTTVGHTKDRYEPLLALGGTADTGGRDVNPERYRATRTLLGQPNVLLIDDTWTTGSKAQSAAIALRRAGAATVAIVTIGRHFDRDFGACGEYYRKARARRFTWSQCCLELPGS